MFVCNRKFGEPATAVGLDCETHLIGSSVGRSHRKSCRRPQPSMEHKGYLASALALVTV